MRWLLFRGFFRAERWHQVVRFFFCYFQEDDDEEHFVDIPDSENDEENGCETKDETQNGAKNETSANGGARTVHDDKTKAYQPQIRNPLYCGAERSCIWELIRMSQHYHPSVCVFARTVLRVSTQETCFCPPVHVRRTIISPGVSTESWWG